LRINGGIKMPNLIVGLKYQPPHEKVETEQQITDVFSDLKKHYHGFNSQFRITTPNGEVIKNFKQFLNIAVGKKTSVVLTGSGDIGGLVVKDASLEYDLSSVSAILRCWDQYRNGSCHGCLNQVRVVDTESYRECKKGKYGRNNCPEYDALRKNSEGRPAKKLVELIEESSK